VPDGSYYLYALSIFHEKGDSVLKSLAFSVFLKFWVAADELKKRGWMDKAADKAASVAFKMDALALKLSALPGVFS
jgi:hypothetical protein